jgi:hypothetical protein
MCHPYYQQAGLRGFHPISTGCQMTEPGKLGMVWLLHTRSHGPPGATATACQFARRGRNLIVADLESASGHRPDGPFRKPFPVQPGQPTVKLSRHFICIWGVSYLFARARGGPARYANRDARYHLGSSVMDGGFATSRSMRSTQMHGCVGGRSLAPSTGTSCATSVSCLPTRSLLRCPPRR